MAVLSPGTVLGERFTIHGVVGRGGSATVYLAEDRLRGTRVALKVVHPHLAADPDARRRLRREVAAAAHLGGEGLLVPFDLHELDGHLVLSLPFHRGRTLSEQVATRGPMAEAELRGLGIRLAAALAEAHGAGVLHRDVTPANVMIDQDGTDAVLTDFGLARTQGGTQTRTTGLLGTAGFAGPEVYMGSRVDPRSDLYGLGGCLYLAASGKPPFDAANPMAALKAQMDDVWEPLSTLRPDLPPALCAAIESLLFADPDRRPDGAAELRELLAGRALPRPVPVVSPATDVVRQYLPPGDWTVVVSEAFSDRQRRHGLRRRHRARRTTEGELKRLGEHIMRGIKDAVGMADEVDAPEDQLAAIVAHEAGLPIGSVLPSKVVYDKKFRLVDRTDEETALRLVAAARGLGFGATAKRIGGPTSFLDLIAQWFGLIIAGGWASFPFFVGLVASVYEPAAGIAALGSIIGMILLTIGLPMLASRRSTIDTAARKLPAAFRADLRTALKDGQHASPRYAVSAAEASVNAPVPAPPTPVVLPDRAGALLGRANQALDALDQSIVANAETLPDPALVDLRDTSRDLRTAAVDLAEELRGLERGLSETSPGAVDAAMLKSRLDRLATMDRAGESVSRAELQSLQRALDAHERDLSAKDMLESRLAATTARLLEVCSTASQARRELEGGRGGDRHSADEAVARLRREVRAARAAVEGR